MKRVLAAAGAVPLVLLAACTSAGTSPAPSGSERTVTSTVTNTRDTGTDYRPPPATYAPQLSSGGKAPEGEKVGRCPYLRSGFNEDPTNKPNAADIGGSRVRLTTTLPNLKPVGCRFYFAYGRTATVDILPVTFGSAIAAHNALVRTAQAGTEVSSRPDFVPGVDGISYRTKFLRADKSRDWAFAFAKGPVLVVVHTQEKTTSFNAVNLAKAIVGKF